MITIKQFINGAVEYTTESTQKAMLMLEQLDKKGTGIGLIPLLEKRIRQDFIDDSEIEETEELGVVFIPAIKVQDDWMTIYDDEYREIMRSIIKIIVSSKGLKEVDINTLNVSGGVLIKIENRWHQVTNSKLSQMFEMILQE